jgi:hypothetical protein
MLPPEGAPSGAHSTFSVPVSAINSLSRFEMSEVTVPMENAGDNSFFMQQFSE